MIKRIQLFQSSTGVSPYMWALFAILPFYFIFQWSSTLEIVAGIIIIHFLFYSISHFVYFKWMGKILMDFHFNYHFNHYDHLLRLCLFCIFSCLFNR